VDSVPKARVNGTYMRPPCTAKIGWGCQAIQASRSASPLPSPTAGTSSPAWPIRSPLTWTKADRVGDSLPVIDR